MRPIDADTLKEEVNKKNVVGRFNTLRLIDNAPTINLEKTSFMKGYNYGCDDGKRFYETPKAEWIDKHFDGYWWHTYSRCKTELEVTPTEKFCRNYGAKMGENEQYRKTKEVYDVDKTPEDKFWFNSWTDARGMEE